MTSSQRVRNQPAAPSEPIVIDDSDDEGTARTAPRVTKRRRDVDNAEIDLTDDAEEASQRKNRRRLAESAGTSRHSDVIVIDD